VFVRAIHAASVVLPIYIYRTWTSIILHTCTMDQYLYSPSGGKIFVNMYASRMYHCLWWNELPHGWHTWARNGHHECSALKCRSYSCVIRHTEHIISTQFISGRETTSFHAKSARGRRVVVRCPTNTITLNWNTTTDTYLSQYQSVLIKRREKKSWLWLFKWQGSGHFTML